MSTLQDQPAEAGRSHDGDRIPTKDVGSILVGEDAVKHGILDEVGGIDRAIRKLREMMDSNIKKDDKAVEKCILLIMTIRLT